MSGDPSWLVGERSPRRARPSTRTWAGQYLTSCLVTDLVRHASCLCPW